MITTTCYTPVGLVFTEQPHGYTLDGQPYLTVTGVLRTANLMDLAYFTEEDRVRGTRVARAIERYHTESAPLLAGENRVGIVGYLRAYLRWQSECAFRVDACEERLADRQLRVAGTLDLRGQFVDSTGTARVDRVDVIDIKTGSMPDWVGYQTAGYMRLLPADVARRCRRWALTLRSDGTYRLDPLVKQSDEAVFLSACTIAHAKRGWL